jgi:hypothetical protein
MKIDFGHEIRPPIPIALHLLSNAHKLETPAIDPEPAFYHVFNNIQQQYGFVK